MAWTYKEDWLQYYRGIHSCEVARWCMNKSLTSVYNLQHLCGQKRNCTSVSLKLPPPNTHMHMPKKITWASVHDITDTIVVLTWFGHYVRVVYRVQEQTTADSSSHSSGSYWTLARLYGYSWDPSLSLSFKPACFWTSQELIEFSYVKRRGEEFGRMTAGGHKCSRIRCKHVLQQMCMWILCNPQPLASTLQFTSIGFTQRWNHTTCIANWVTAVPKTKTLHTEDFPGVFISWFSVM